MDLPFGFRKTNNLDQPLPFEFSTYLNLREYFWY